MLGCKYFRYHRGKLMQYATKRPKENFSVYNIADGYFQKKQKLTKWEACMMNWKMLNKR